MASHSRKVFRRGVIVVSECRRGKVAFAAIGRHGATHVLEVSNLLVYPLVITCNSQIKCAGDALAFVLAGTKRESAWAVADFKVEGFCEAAVGQVKVAANGPGQASISSVVAVQWPNAVRADKIELSIVVSAS